MKLVFSLLTMVLLSTQAQAERFVCIRKDTVQYRLTIEDGRVSRIFDQTIHPGRATAIPVVEQEESADGVIEATGQHMDTDYYTFKFRFTPKGYDRYTMKVVNRYFQMTAECMPE